MIATNETGAVELPFLDYSETLVLERVRRDDPEMSMYMRQHYSMPKGFVGRSICYAIMFGGTCYGSIAGGSATRFLPNREVIGTLNNGINNIFFHIDQNKDYPQRNFTQKVLKLYRGIVERDWKSKYGDEVFWHETLVELPRTGECYRRDGWKLVGQTKGQTCKRVAGKGSDSWGGKRVWDTKNLRPKLVFIHSASITAEMLHTDEFITCQPSTDMSKSHSCGRVDTANI